MIPTITWEGNHIRLVDQRRLPLETRWVECRSLNEVIEAIKDMAIRGAPAIGVAAAMGLALGAHSIEAQEYEAFREKFLGMAREVEVARPTAVNIGWAVKRMKEIMDGMQGRGVDEIKVALKRASQDILENDIEINRRIGEQGLPLIPDRATILTHCNAGSLATGGYGTALGVIRAAHEAGKDIHIVVDETRPLLQGMRLTAFELMEEGISTTVIVDSAAGYLMRRGKVDLVIIGADRIAANGDTANKVGSYQLAVLAKENRIPFYVAAPLSTFDFTLKEGDQIPIEERDPQEVVTLAGQQLGPKGCHVFNPAFDITPGTYISAIITEKGVLRPPLGKNIQRLVTK
jgi:methylthioribose-1-phosphate isomerase